MNMYRQSGFKIHSYKVIINKIEKGREEEVQKQ